MSYRDILLPLLTYPDPPSMEPVRVAFRLAKRLGAKVNVVLLELDPDRSVWPSSLGTHLVDISSMIGDALAISQKNARQAAEEIQAQASLLSIRLQLLPEFTTFFPSPSSVVEHARLHDLTVLPASSGFDNWFIESLVFGSGSPVLLVPESQEFDSLDTIAVAWDFSLASSRAVRASIPLLGEGKTVRILTVMNEKNIVTDRTIEDLRRHLSEHGISFIHDEVDIGGRRIGAAFRTYTKEVAADILVMGAFGHSRVREFILGGATESMLSNPPAPVLFMH